MNNPFTELSLLDFMALYTHLLLLFLITGACTRLHLAIFFIELKSSRVYENVDSLASLVARWNCGRLLVRGL